MLNFQIGSTMSWTSKEFHDNLVHVNHTYVMIINVYFKGIALKPQHVIIDD